MFVLQLDANIERMHAAKECKATSVLSKFKEMEKRVANGEDIEDDARKCSCIQSRSRWILLNFCLFLMPKNVVSLFEFNETFHDEEAVERRV